MKKGDFALTLKRSVCERKSDRALRSLKFFRKKSGGTHNGESNSHTRGPIPVYEETIWSLPKLNGTASFKIAFCTVYLALKNLSVIYL